MTAGAGRLDRRFGVGILLVAVAFVALDAAGLWRLFAIGHAVIGVLRIDAAAFIRSDRRISRLVAVKAGQHHFALRVRLLVCVVAFLAIRRVFRLCMVSVIEV
jgi:hypothetical protein